MKEVTTRQLLDLLVQNEVLHADRALQVQVHVLFGDRDLV